MSKVKTTTIPNKKNQKIEKEEDSSDISSYDENENYGNMTSDEISQKAHEKYFKTELMEKIIKYIKIDDSIKEKQKEVREQVKCLKTQKMDMEKYIITYLESINQEFVNIEGAAKLTKTVSVSKGAIKHDNIKSSIVDGIKKQNINIDSKKIDELLENVMEFVEKNRPTKTKTYIKRTKGKTEKALRKIVNDNKDSSDEEELPKFDPNKKK
jgi:hypothetical protein